MSDRKKARATTALITLIASTPLRAQQCEPAWRVVDGVNDIVYAIAMWDPDGAGPREPIVVVGGRFTQAGGAPANHIATWNPATGVWEALGSGMNGSVRALTALPDGDLIAGGEFFTAGGVEAHKVARWDGERWHAMGAGLPGGSGGFEFPTAAVYAFVTTPRGELMAGGNFFLEGGGTSLRNLATWDGDTWQPLSERIDQQISFAVQCMSIVPGGDLIVGGYIFGAGTVETQGIARWDGAEWSAMGSGLTISSFGFGGPFAMVNGPSGELVVGGDFHVDQPAGERIRWLTQWDGAEWRPLGEGVNDWVFALLPRPDGGVIVGGWFDAAGGQPAPGLARWDGEQWSDLPGAAATTYALAELPGGDIAVGHRRGLAIWGCRDCYADCDGDQSLDFFDFLCFQNLFAAGDPTADCDGDGELAFFDFLCFQNAFAAGCP